MFSVSKKEFFLIQVSHFCFVGSVKPLLPPFPSLSFPVGVLSMSLRFSSWVMYLKLSLLSPHNGDSDLTSAYCNTSFGPRSPLSPANANNFHCPLSSLFSIYVNSVPPLMSASNFQLFFPVTSSALSAVLYQCCRKLLLPCTAWT